MPAIPLRQRSSTELVDAAFQVYRREPLQFITAVGIVYVPVLVFMLFVSGGTSALATGNIGYALSFTILSYLAYTFANAVSSLLASDIYLGRPTDLAAAYRTTFRSAGTLIVATIVWGIAVSIGFMLLIFPALYVIARFFCIRQVVVLEAGSVDKAFSRSSMLSADIKRHVLNTQLLVWLLVIAVSVGGGWLFSLVPSQAVQSVLSIAMYAVLYPFFGITETLLYYDARIRKEGFDIEFLASAIDSPGAASASAPI